MNLQDFTTALLFAAAIISIITLAAGFFRSRSDEERALEELAREIRQKQKQVAARQKERGELRARQVAQEIAELKRRIFEGKEL
jgi:hypothetical protein